MHLILLLYLEDTTTADTDSTTDTQGPTTATERTTTATTEKTIIISGTNSALRLSKFIMTC